MPRKRRMLPMTYFQIARDLQAPDLEIQRDIQSILQCSSAEAHRYLQRPKESPETAKA